MVVQLTYIPYKPPVYLFSKQIYLSNQKVSTINQLMDKTQNILDTYIPNILKIYTTLKIILIYYFLGLLNTKNIEGWVHNEIQEKETGARKFCPVHLQSPC